MHDATNSVRLANHNNSYAKSFTKNESFINICESGLKLIQGINKQEVAIVPRKREKKGIDCRQNIKHRCKI